MSSNLSSLAIYRATKKTEFDMNLLLRVRSFTNRLKEPLYVIIVIWLAQIMNYIVNWRFFGRFGGLLGINIKSLQRINMPEGYLFFILWFIILAYILNTTKFSISNFTKYSSKRILFILVVIAAITPLSHYFVKWRWNRIEDRREEANTFNLVKFNQSFFDNLQNRNVLFADQTEIENKYNILQQGRTEKSGTTEKSLLKEGKAELGTSPNAMIRGEVTDKTKINFDINAGVDLKLIQVIKEFAAINSINVLHLEIPTPLIKSVEKSMKSFVEDLQYFDREIWWSMPSWGYDFQKYQLSNNARNLIKRELEDYLYTSFIRTNMPDNITGMTIAVGNYKIQSKSDSLLFSSRVEYSGPSISLKLQIDSRALPIPKRSVFNISQDQTLKLIVFGYAREIKGPTTEPNVIGSRNIIITNPIAILE